jgi:hypothetical protein
MFNWEIKTYNVLCRPIEGGTTADGEEKRRERDEGKKGGGENEGLCG